MTASLVLALLGVSPGPFDGCRVEGPSAGIERRIECAELRVSVTVDKPLEAGRAAMLDVVDRLSATDGGSHDAGVRELSVGGERRPARSYDAGKRAGWVVLLPSGKARVRLAQCEESKQGGCLAAFEALLGGLPAPTSSAAGHPLRLGDRTLVPPEGCRSPAPARIECPGAALTWSHFGADEADIFEVSVQALEAGMSRLGSVTRTDRPCAVAGAKTRCAVLTITKADGASMYAVFGVGAARGEQVAAQCNSARPVDSGLPRPCDQALTF